MYSGIGRTVFEFAKGMASRASFEFAIDDACTKNRDLVVRFCKEQGLPVHIGRGYSISSALDHGNLDLPSLLKQDRWDAVNASAGRTRRPTTLF